jgi:hypothetical protein
MQATRHESHHGHGLLRGVLDAFGRRTGLKQIADETFSQIRLPPASAADDLGVGPVQRDPGTALLSQPRSEPVVIRVNVCDQHAPNVAQSETGVPESSDEPLIGELGVPAGVHEHNAGRCLEAVAQDVPQWIVRDWNWNRPQARPNFLHRGQVIRRPAPLLIQAGDLHLDHTSSGRCSSICSKRRSDSR